MERVKSIGEKYDLQSKYDKAVSRDACHSNVRRELEIWKAFELDWKVDWHSDKHCRFSKAA